MTANMVIKKSQALLNAFKRYKERYLNAGKKPNVEKLFREDLYHTTRLEGEKITKKEAQALFR